MGRPWAICLATYLNAVVGAMLVAGGAWAVGVAVLALLGPPDFFRGILVIGGLFGLGALAVGCILSWVGLALWKGASWARWPSALLALALVPGAVLLTVWVGQGGLLILVFVGPVITIGLFLPAARRFVGTEAAEIPET